MNGLPPGAPFTEVKSFTKMSTLGWGGGAVGRMLVPTCLGTLPQCLATPSLDDVAAEWVQALMAAWTAQPLGH